MCGPAVSFVAIAGPGSAFPEAAAASGVAASAVPTAAVTEGAAAWAVPAAAATAVAAVSVVPALAGSAIATAVVGLPCRSCSGSPPLSSYHSDSSNDDSDSSRSQTGSSARICKQQPAGPGAETK